MLLGFPDGDSPVADGAAEAIGLPAIEGGSDDGNVRGVGFEAAPKIRNKGQPIVEAPVPCENEASARHVWLFFPSRLGCGVEGPIEKRNGTLHIAGLAVWTLVFRGLTDIREKLAVDRPSVKVPDPRLHAHTVLLL